MRDFVIGQVHRCHLEQQLRLTHLLMQCMCRLTMESLRTSAGFFWERTATSCLPWTRQHHPCIPHLQRTDLLPLLQVLDKFLSHAHTTFQSDDVALRLSLLNAYELTRASGFSPALLRCNAQSVCGQDELLFTAMHTDGGAGKGRHMRLELLPTPSCFAQGEDGIKDRKRSDVNHPALLQPSASCTASPPFLRRSIQHAVRAPIFDTIGLEFRTGRGGAGFDYVPFTVDACAVETSGRCLRAPALLSCLVSDY
jgi:hypothetical protein